MALCKVIVSVTVLGFTYQRYSEDIRLVGQKQLLSANCSALPSVNYHNTVLEYSTTRQHYLRQETTELSAIEDRK